MATGGTAVLEPHHGRWAVEYARRVVESVVKDGTAAVEPEETVPILERERGAFVTLEKGGNLRGCIGRPDPDQRGISAIREAATGAAQNDPRFPPVRPEELESITVEVSVLTAPESLDGTGSDTLVDAIDVGRDGLIVNGSGRSGLLLPQVPLERGWDAAEFLSQTCRKAGLPMDAWQDQGVTVERFSAQVFAETTPGGAVEQVELETAEGL